MLKKFAVAVVLTAQFGFGGIFGLFGAPAARQQAQATVLDQAEIPCNNCFFGPSYHYYCFAVQDSGGGTGADKAADKTVDKGGEKVLVGYQRTPTMNWRDDSKNYLAKARHKWQMWTPGNGAVAVSYDAKNIWVNGEKGKPVKLFQDYSHDVFSASDPCRMAIKTNR